MSKEFKICHPFVQTESLGLKQNEIEIWFVFCVRYYLEGIEDLTQILTRKETETRFKSVHYIIRACFVNEASWLSSSAASTRALALSDSDAERLLSPMFKHHDRRILKRLPAALHY